MEDKNYYQRTGYVSNSSLNYLKKLPKLFKSYLDGTLEEDTKDFFRYGQIVHLKILEEEEYDNTVLVYDYKTPKSAQQKAFIEDMINIADDNKEAIINIYKKYYKNKESDEKIVEKGTKLLKEFERYSNYLKLRTIKTIISKSESERINAIASNCRNHKGAKEILFDLPHPLSKDGVETHNEYEILWNYNGIACKSLLDRHIIDYNTHTIKLPDFKTTSKLANFKESFKAFGYDRQLQFYTYALQYHLKTKLTLSEWNWEWYIVAADSITNEVRSFEIFEEDLEDAKKELTDLFNRAKWHMDNDKWAHSMEYYLGNGHERLC